MLGSFKSDRLFGLIEPYEGKHIRHCLTDQQMYEINQPDLPHRKPADLIIQKKIKTNLEMMPLNDRVELIMDTVP